MTLRTNSTDQTCDPYFADGVAVGGEELRVYRCDWGWCVKRGDVAGRSRYLDEAFEQALGRRLDRDATRALIDMLDRDLSAERERTRHTALRTLPRDAVAGA